MLKLREDTITAFHKHKIPLLNALTRALPSCEFDMFIHREKHIDNPDYTTITIRSNDKFLNIGFDNEFDAILYFRGMALMKDFLSSCTEQEFLTSILNATP